MLTVVSWLWKMKKNHPRRPMEYNARHVNALDRMLKDHMTGDWRHVCATDTPEGIECEVFPLWDFPEVVQKTRKLDCWNRIKVFDPETGKQFGERILSLDLDVVIEDDLMPLIDESEDFQAIRGRNSQYNASIWTMKVGTNRHVWDNFDPLTSEKIIGKTNHNNGHPLIGSDQAWFTIQIPNKPVWDQEDGCWTYAEMAKIKPFPEFRRITVFPGVLKPWHNDSPSWGFQHLRKTYLSYFED